MTLTVTRGISEALNDGPTKAAVSKAIGQFLAGDWGKVPIEDKEANNADLRAGTGRILARYETPQGDIYIISYPGTEEPPTILFCSEY